jgi:WD40 repeat protein
VRSLVFSADGSKLFAGNWEESVQVWDTRTGLPAMSPLPHKGLSTYAALALSPNGQWLATLSLEGTVRIWDATTGHLALPELRHSSAAWQMDFDASGQRLAVGCVDGTTHVWDFAHAEPVSVQLKQSRKVYNVSFSPDKERLLTASSDGTIRVWDLGTGAMTFSPWAEKPSAVLDLANPRRLLTQDSNGPLHLWDTTTWKPVAPTLPEKGVVARAWLSRDEKRLFSLSAPAPEQANRLEFKTWDLTSGTQIATIENFTDPDYSVWVSPDCQRVAIVVSNRMTVVNASTGQSIWNKSFKTDAIRYVAFDPAGARMAILTRTETHVLDVTSGNALFAPLKLAAIGMCADFSPDGQLLATGAGDEFAVDREARVWDAKTGKPLTAPLEHHGAIASVFFSPDGRNIITASHDRAARIWNARTGKPVTAPLRHTTGVSYAVFSPDSRRAATFTEDGAARVWDAVTGEPLTPPLEHPAGLTAGSFLADGKYVLAHHGQNISLWDISTESRSVKDWAAIASLLAAKRFNVSSFLEPMDPTLLAADWKTLHGKYADAFNPAHGFISLNGARGTSLPPSPIRPVPVTTPPK